MNHWIALLEKMFIYKFDIRRQERIRVFFIIQTVKEFKRTEKLLRCTGFLTRFYFLSKLVLETK